MNLIIIVRNSGHILMAGRVCYSLVYVWNSAIISSAGRNTCSIYTAYQRKKMLCILHSNRKTWRGGSRKIIQKLCITRRTRIGEHPRMHRVRAPNIRRRIANRGECVSVSCRVYVCCVCSVKCLYSISSCKDLHICGQRKLRVSGAFLVNYC